MTVASSASLSSTLAIETLNLTKQFGDATVVDALSLSVPRGAVYGFLGPNGCGKTTTIRMLLGLISPTAGEVRVLGEPIPHGSGQVLPQVGALVEGPAFYPWLSGADNLARFDAAGPRSDRKGRGKRIADALERVGLTAAAGKQYKAYSLGMRQRLGLANAMLMPRQLLILDEPTNGMDPQGTREIRHLIRELAADGTTVFLSSHLLPEIEQVCSHVAVMNLGKLLTQGTLEDLQATTTTTLRVETVDLDLATTTLTSHGLSPLAASSVLPNVVQAPLDGAAADDVCRALVLAGVRITSFTVERPTLEDTFVSLTGEGFDVAR